MAPTSAKLIKATQFECVSFFDPEQKRQVVIIYSLGQDGVVREFTGGRWNEFPITPENSQEFKLQPPPHAH